MVAATPFQTRSAECVDRKSYLPASLSASPNHLIAYLFIVFMRVWLAMVFKSVIRDH